MAGAEEEAKVVRGASLLILLQVVSRAITFVANQILLRFLTAQLLGISTQLEVYYLSVLFFARESLRVAIQRQGSIRATSDPSQALPKQQPPQAGHAETNPQTSPGKSATAADPQSPPLQQQQQQQETQAVVNLSYISIGLGFVVAALLGSLYLASAPAAAARAGTPYFVPAVYAYAAAAVLELLAEPAFVVAQLRLRFAARARAEGLATLAKCVATLAAAAWAARRGVALGVLPFALGQVAFGWVLLGAYTVQHLYEDEGGGRDGGGDEEGGGFSLLPRWLGGGREGGEGRASSPYVFSLFYRPTLTLASSMMIQSFVKHLLTQGDTFLVSILSTPTAQGVYALANAYGGLAARLVFQPVEESSRSYFSRLLSSTSTSSPPSANGSTTTTPPIPGDKPPHDDHDHDHDNNSKQKTLDSTTTTAPSRAALAQASENLTSLLRLYTLASLPVLALGPTAAPLLLAVVAGPRWTAAGAGDALAAYVYYVPLLAVNGLTEAFVASVATGAQVHRQSAWMTAFSLVFAAAGYVLLRVLGWGAVGLVCANGVNMACRIAWAVWFIRGYFASASSRSNGGTAGAGAGAGHAVGTGAVSWDPSGVLPSPMAVAAAAVASQVVRRVVTSTGVSLGAGANAGAEGVAVVAGGIQTVLWELVKIAGVAVPFVGVL